MSLAARRSDGYWHRAIDADMRVGVSRASLLVAAVIAFSFVGLPVFQVLEVSAASAQDHQAEDQFSVPNDPYLSSLSSFRGRNWDWSSYADESDYVDVIVSEHDGAGDSAYSLSDLRAFETNSYSLALQGFSARIDLDTLERYSSIANPAVEIYPDLPVKATQMESIQQIGADLVWSMTDSNGDNVKGLGIVVAVIDTGIDYTHPDLGGGFGPSYKVMGGYDFYNHDSDPMDDNGHGTHVAGIIAANGNMTGVAPAAKLLAYKALGSEGNGAMSNVILAIDAALDPNGDGDPADKADVISMSLGGAGEATDPICQAVQNAVEAGVVVVVAAGNSGPGLGTVASPGVAPDAITVGAVNATGSLASFSSRGTPNSLLIKPEISAPGVNILSTVPRSGTKHSSPTGYASLSGTSMATPHVSGAVALLLQLHNEWTPAQVKSALISGSAPLNESLWQAGAGGLWVPPATSQRLFAVQPLVSYGLASDPGQSVTVLNSGSSIALAAASTDRFSMSADGSSETTYWLNASVVSPTSFTISSGLSAQIVLGVNNPGLTAPEGYYEGNVRLTGTGGSLRIPFGFALLSTLTVHVLNATGNEVFDPYGGVWIWNLPEASVALGVRGDYFPAPPATFMVPSGNYSVHAAGHQLVYTYADPYLLSDVTSLGRMQTKEIYLHMAEARPMVIDLQTEDGKPIYVKDYRVYCRYTGQHNVSFHLTGSDYSVRGSEVFSLKSSKTVYVSDTTETVGVSIAGFSYTPAMWDFMNRNWKHWYEFIETNSNEFYVEASADLQYLLAWEFHGVDSSTSTSLTLNPAVASTYDTKYDIPGSLQNAWGDWGTHLSIGGDSTFYMRRDTDTSLNPFFSGMTRKTIVQGVWSEPYFYGSLFDGYFVRPFYIPDYNHSNRADTISDIYLPDRNFLKSIDGLATTERLGAGPYYPSVRMANTNASLELFHPLLRDQAGADVAGMYVPSMRLYRNGGLVGIYQLSEYLARTNAKRVVDLSADGVYLAEISYRPTPQICSDVTISLRFNVPSLDLNPPRITGLAMPQRFVAGSPLPVQISVLDDVSLGSVALSWKPSSETGYRSLTLTSSEPGVFNTAIPTSAADDSIDLDLLAYDASGNYIEYVALSASKRQIPVLMDLVSDRDQIGYRNGDAFVVLSGHLTDLSGNPIHSSAGIPIEMTLNGEKIAMILDEYDEAASHTHNGDIRFEWHFNPAKIFTGPDETINIDVVFDLGTYEPVHRTITLNSIYYYNPAPIITLRSPTNGSLIPAGRLIDIEVSDDGSVEVEMRLDGGAPTQLQSPWDVNTSKWSDGDHSLEIIATDDQLVTSNEWYTFHVDKSTPVVRILEPLNGTKVPRGWTLTAQVSDDHLDQVTYSLDNGTPVFLLAPYSIDMAGWPVGDHGVTITATDLAGHSASDGTYFEIGEGTLEHGDVSPQNGSVIRSGVPIVFSVLSLATYSSNWEEYGVWHSLGVSTTISTSGWAEGLHTVTINSTDSLGGWAETVLTFTIDDTKPVVSLISPLESQLFVDPSDIISIRVTDANFQSVVWTMWGRTRSSASPDLLISLAGSPGDGYFTVNVSTVDKAGNSNGNAFVFAMDSAAPTLTYSGLVDGAPVLPTQVVTVKATDVFLSGVSLAIDDGTPVQLQAPYQFNCSSLSFGPHSAQLVATDYSGKFRSVNLSFYVDGTAPTIVPSFPASGKANTSLVLEANITDDYAVSRAELHYQLAAGSFILVLLQGNGSVFSATLPGSALWDGMVAFVVAYDYVGHSSESDHLVLHIIADSDDGATPTEPRGGPFDLSSTVVVLGLITLGLVSGSVVMYFVLIAGRRGRRHGSLSGRTGKASQARARLASQGPPASVFVWPPPSSTKETPMVDRAPATTYAEPSRTARPAVASVEKPVSLLDSIPTVTIKSPAADGREPNDGIDYGDLIERELLLPSLKQSVFAKDTDERFEEVDRQLDELETMLAKDQKKLLR